MDGIRGNVSDQPFKCSICQGDDGGTTNEFAGRLQVKTSCPDRCQLHLGCVPQLTDQQPLKLDQRRCTTCQTLPVLPLLCLSKSVQEYACSSGNWQALDQVLKINFDRGVNIHLDEHLLFIALEQGNSECLEVLCRAGANVNATVKNGATPLHKAAYYGDIKSLKVLLKTPKVKVSAAENDGFTPLHWAATNGDTGHTDCLKVLLDTLGVDVNVKDNFGLTPLHLATINGNSDSLKLLLATPGIDINFPCNLGLTPLHYAAIWDRVDCLEELLSKGANINSTGTDEYGDTPLDRAGRHSACAERLISKGAKTRLELKALQLTLPALSGEGS